MWVFAENAFISIAAVEHDPENLMIRARFSGDITELFPDAHVVPTPHRDFAFCATIPRDEVIAVIASRIKTLRETAPDASEQYVNYFDVWAAMRVRKMRGEEEE